jgi:hypothetical protein
MDYARIYYNIIERSKNRQIDYFKYYEKHHIIPKCMGGSDDEKNIATLTAREHYLCHMLLLKMFPENKKLIYSAIYMTCHNSNNRSKNKTYEWLRKKFIENHPCKEDSVKSKIRNSLNEYYNGDNYRNISKIREIKYREKRLCACGCGEMFVVYKKSKKRYISTSHIPKTDDTKRKQSKSMKEYLKKITHEEMSERMRKSLGNFDPKERGHLISISKKGKKTNQQDIMGKKYANMTDEDFLHFLNKCSPRVHTRMTNLRNKWKK